MVRVPVDLGVVTVDGRDHVFIAHAVFRTRWWGGVFVVVMNAQWCGELDLAPRSHPGDGLLDITEGQLPIRQRRAARTRALSGSHLPHPGLSVRRASTEQVETGHRTMLLLDGVRVQRCSSASVRIESDAVEVYV